MKDNLRKIKNIIGLSALLILGVLMFLGLNFKLANSLAAAFIVIPILAIGYLFLSLALKGREERGGHSRKWIVIGWISSVFYIVVLIGMMPSANHFIAVNQDKIAIQDTARMKVDAMLKINADYSERVEIRAEDLKNALQRHILNNETSLLKTIYQVHPGGFDYRWAAGEKSSLMSHIYDNQVDKLSYNMISDQWSGKFGTKSENTRYAIRHWNVLIIARAMETLDKDIEKNIKVLQTSYAYQDPYSNHFGKQYSYDIDEPEKSQLDKQIYGEYFNKQHNSPLGLFIAILLVILAAFPIIFVQLNRVRPINKRFADVYSKGYSIDELQKSEEL